MIDARIIIFFMVWSIFIIGYGGGHLYILRFLREHEMIDTRVIPFFKNQLFGDLGSDYKIFYYAHSQKYGKKKTISLLAFHFASIVMIVIVPIVMLG